MSSKITTQEISLNLSKKNYDDLSDIFSTLSSTHPNVQTLNISENNLTKLPPDWSSFPSLYSWDIRSNPFKNFNEIIQSLSTLPSWSQWTINLTDESQVMQLLTKLPNLVIWNGKPTKKEPHQMKGMIDVNDEEILSISFQNKITTFNDIFKTLYNSIVPIESKDTFKEGFECRIKREIAKINSNGDSVPNYLYASSVLNSEFTIFSYFNEKYIELITSKNKALGSLARSIHDNMVNSYSIQVNILYKLYPIINEKTKILKEQWDEALKANVWINNEINKYEEKVKQMSNDKDWIILKFQEEISMLQGQIGKLENENKILTSKIIKSAHAIIDKNSSWVKNVNNTNSNFDNNLQNNSTNNISYYINHNKSSSWKTSPLKAQNTSTPAWKNCNSTSNISSNPLMWNNNPLVVSSPTCSRVFTIKMMKDVIKDIYSSKGIHDMISNQNKLPKETLEQHMYTYLNQKYGLKQIIIEWASNIINGIKIFSNQDSEIYLFGRILRNEIDEDSHFIFSKLNQSVNDLIWFNLKAKHPLKPWSDWNDIQRDRIKGRLTEEEWKEILNYLYEEEDYKYWERTIIDIIQRKYLKNKFESEKKYTREEIIALSQKKDEYDIPYKEFIKIWHEFQVKSREKYLKGFVLLFKGFDTDNNGLLSEEEFINMVYSTNIYGEEVKEKIVKLLTRIDPFNNKQISFSECVMVFENEGLIDERGNDTGSLLAKICGGDNVNN